MSTNEDDAQRPWAERPLSAAERARLAELRSGPALPPELEQAVITDLCARGLLGGRARGPAVPAHRLRRAAAVLVAVLAGLAGLAGGRALWGPAATDGVVRAPGERFLLLVHEPLGAPPLAPAELELRSAEYARWARSLGEAVLGGAPLAERVALLRGDGAGGVALERGAGQSSTLGGYFLLAAPDEARAEAIARGCPHLRHGGWLELRRLEQVGGG